MTLFRSQINLKSEIYNLQSQTSVPVRNDRQAAPLADEAIDRPVARLCKRFRTHAAAKRRKLVIGFACECRARRVVQEGARLLQELPVKRFEPIAEGPRLVVAPEDSSRSISTWRAAPRTPRAAVRAASSSVAARSISGSNDASSVPADRADVRRSTTRLRCSGSDG